MFRSRVRTERYFSESILQCKTDVVPEQMTLVNRFFIADKNIQRKLCSPIPKPMIPAVKRFFNIGLYLKKKTHTNSANSVVRFQNE